MSHQGEPDPEFLDQLGSMNDLALEVAFFDSLDDDQRSLAAQYLSVGRGTEGVSEAYLDMFSLVALKQEVSTRFSPVQEAILGELTIRRSAEATGEVT